MKREELFEYFKLKYKELLVAFEVIFELNSTETDKVILQLLSSNDTFYNLSNYEFLDIRALVNLKKYFPSKTMSNFFSYITLEAKMKKDKLNTFENILEFVIKFDPADKVKP